MSVLGHDVVGVDVDPEKISLLAHGKAPFHEPGFDDLLNRAVASGRLRFTTDVSQIRGARAHFLAVGTPQRRDGLGADLSFVDSVVGDALPHLEDPDDVGPALLVGKSTVPVGTAGRIAERLRTAGSRTQVVWNPEFLREGFAVQDTIAPDRLVLGLPPDDEAAALAQSVMEEVYADLLLRDTPLIATDYATAELIKVAANSFLATKISFINAMAELCDATGADVQDLATAIGYDDRIGHKFLKAGIGFGGGCLPKDIRAFMARAEELGAQDALAFLREIDAINLRRRSHVVELAQQECGGTFAGKNVAVLGAAFKPHSDDMRDSPALDVADRIRARGAHVVVTDPAAGEPLARQRPELTVAADASSAAEGADVVLLLTEWPQFVDLDPAALGRVVRSRTIIDGRNALDAATWRAAGWTYRGMGRP
jgi:UDPglucose 6-dehydrogenase